MIVLNLDDIGRNLELIDVSQRSAMLSGPHFSTEFWYLY